MKRKYNNKKSAYTLYTPNWGVVKIRRCIIGGYAGSIFCTHPKDLKILHVLV